MSRHVMCVPIRCFFFARLMRCRVCPLDLAIPLPSLFFFDGSVKLSVSPPGVILFFLTLRFASSWTALGLKYLLGGDGRSPGVLLFYVRPTRPSPFPLFGDPTHFRNPGTMFLWMSPAKAEL